MDAPYRRFVIVFAASKADADPLGPYNVDKSRITVSGVSSAVMTRTFG